MDLRWFEIRDGVHGSEVGGDFFPLLPRSTGKAGAGKLPLDESQVTCREADGGLVLSLPLGPDERLHGLGTNFKTLDLRGRIYELKVDHYGGKDNGHTHAPVPFYVSSRGYGVFVNVSERLKVYAGGVHPFAKPPELRDRLGPGWKDVAPGSTVEIFVPGEGFELVLFGGASMLEVVERFNMHCGGGCLPPKWGLGFWHRIKMEATAEDAIKMVDDFAAHSVPLQVLGLEPGWHSSCYPCTYEFRESHFPNPEKFFAEMARRGVRVNLWENCMVHPDSRLAEELGPRHGDYHAGWGGLVPDLNDPEAREIFGRQHERAHIALGNSGYKLDECDGFDQWLWPDHAQFPSGMNGVQLRQQFGLQYQRALDAVFRRRNRRTYGLVRASNAGSASLPFVLYNDCYAHRDFIAGMINCGFSGLLFTPEARKADSAEDLLRRVQAVCMSPMAMINAWADATEPWSFPEVADQIREVIELRIRLLPYLYSAFAKYHIKGTPPFRAMALEGSFKPPEEADAGKLDSVANPYATAVNRDVLDQYMMGDDLMVCPLFAGEPERKVVLPAGRWYDFHTGKLAGEREVITVKATCKNIPIYVRDGAVVPLLKAAKFPGSGQDAPLEVRHYGKLPGQFELYDDDGESFDNERGAFSWTTLRAVRDNGGWRGEAVAKTGSYCSNYGPIEWVFM